ncbi:hypothetical protein [Halococcus saccharolyticus]|nr:hypothetical protein [Halococcus saccharolyticus]
MTTNSEEIGCRQSATDRARGSVVLLSGMTDAGSAPMVGEGWR